MFTKTIIALVAVMAVSLVVPTAASARRGYGGVGLELGITPEAYGKHGPYGYRYGSYTRFGVCRQYWVWTTYGYRWVQVCG
jgi:hypothetical protein